MISSSGRDLNYLRRKNNDKPTALPAALKLILDASDYGMHDANIIVPPRLGPTFLDLPLELRTRVYEFVFVSAKYIGSEGTQTKAFKKDLYKWRNFAFARSCRLIYEESTRVFFSKNGFMFFFHRPALEFLEEIGPARRKLLTKLRFTFNHAQPFVALRYIKSCTSLKELKVVSRVNVEGHRAAWWIVTLKNAKEFFLTEYDKIEFDKPYYYGDKRKSFYNIFGEIPAVPEFSTDEMAQPPKMYSVTLKWLYEALSKVKREQQGKYLR